jgi:hypothetical protein
MGGGLLQHQQNIIFKKLIEEGLGERRIKGLKF